MSKTTIAIVEDEEIALLSMKKHMEQHFPDLRVIWTAGNGKAALDRLQQEPPDILIADIEMPVMDGLALCEQLHARHYEGVILIHTAYARFEYAKKALALGVFDYVLKPVSSEDLEDTVTRAIHESDRRKQERDSLRSAQSVENQMKQYALSLASFGSADSRQLKHFLETVGWPKDAPLQTVVYHFFSENAFSGTDTAWFSNTLRLMDEAGFLVNADYISDRHYLVVLQPNTSITDAQLYTLSSLFGRIMLACSPRIRADISGPHDSYAQVTRQCHKPLPAGQSERLRMKPRAWRLIRKADYEKDSSTLKRFLKDGNTSRAESYLKRRLHFLPGQEEAMFWELALLCSDLVQAFDPDFPVCADGAIRQSVRCLFEDRILPEDTTKETDMASRTQSARPSDQFRTMMPPEAWFSVFLAECAGERRPDDKNAFDSLLEWMNTSFDTQVSLSAAAEKMGMDQAYFSRYFKKMTGQKFIDYLTDVRMKHTEQLLRENPDIPLTELAQACGYSSRTYFSEVFKKWKGMTISQYLKKQTEKNE